MFSIVIPLYNKEQYIARTIRSVLSQTYQDFEIMIIDDGSTDGSVDAASSIQDSRIRITSQANSGVSAARNRGIEEASHEWIAFLDADDEWLPEHLATFLKLAHDFPDCSVLATNYKIIDSAGKERLIVDTDKVLLSQSSGILNDYFDSASRTAPPLWTSAIAARKNSLKNIGGFPVGIPMGEDLLTWAKLACKYQIAYSKTITAIYHFHTIAEMMNPWKKPDEIDSVGIELRKLMGLCCLPAISLKHYIALWHKMRLNEAMKCGERIASLKEIREIIRYDKKLYKSYIMLILAFMPQFIRKKLLKIIVNYQEKKYHKSSLNG